MTNFEYLISILEDEELVEMINSIETEYIPELSNVIYDNITSYYDFYKDNYIEDY